MIVYTAYEPGLPAKSPGERADEVVFIKEGFTWWGFLFGPFWLLFNGLWFEFVGALLLAGGLSALLAGLGLKDQAPGIAHLALALIVGFEGNGLRCWRLERKGYTLLAPVAASGYEECERRFFEAWLPSLAQPAKPEPKPAMNHSPNSWGDWAGPGVAGTFPGEIV